MSTTVEIDMPTHRVGGAFSDHPIVILPDRLHRVEPSTDAVFAVQFFDPVD